MVGWAQIAISQYSLPTGEGSFGRVLQAKAEGIVPGMPDRNIVAIKTTKGTTPCVYFIYIYI